ncbi:hypothetical protein SSU98_0241 [Streptococcus suis 98HAH33]|nr:hypothetical protein SSU05_0246 [Streptococcus suis 05ZYH33]ABP91399.1 hypothetical protein SSU98_0241 [Streptococcus suis 98HAH33]
MDVTEQSSEKGRKNPVECIKWQIVNEVKLE